MVVCVCREGQRGSPVGVIAVPREITPEEHPDPFSGLGQVYSGVAGDMALTLSEVNEHLVASGEAAC